MAGEQLIVCLADNKNFYLEKDKVLADSWPFDCGGCFSGPCDECVLQAKPMTRTEAIERMANAMYDPYFNDVHASEPDMLEALAEAALDALVGKGQI